MSWRRRLTRHVFFSGVTLLVACGSGDRSRHATIEALDGAAGANSTGGGGGTSSATGGQPTTPGGGAGGMALSAGGSVDGGQGAASDASVRSSSLDGSVLDGSVSSYDASFEGGAASRDAFAGDAACVPSTAAPTLVSYWAAENDFTDSQGNNDGTNIGGVTFVAGHVGNAFHFDSGSSEYVGVAHDPSLDLRTYTISAWIRSSVSTTYWGTVVSKELHGSGTPWTDRNYGLFINKGDVCAAGIPSLVQTGANVCATTAVSGAWQHLAATFDGCVARIYVDGVLEGSAPSAVPPTGPEQDLWLGSWEGLDNGEDLDEVRVYRGALDAAAIATAAAN